MCQKAANKILSANVVGAVRVKTCLTTVKFAISLEIAMVMMLILWEQNFQTLLKYFMMLLNKQWIHEVYCFFYMQ